MTKKQVLEALEQCAKTAECIGCRYDKFTACKSILLRDVFKIVNEQAKTIEEQEERIAIMAEQMETIQDRTGATPDIDGGGMIWFFCCGECRQTIKQGWKFCPECGKKVVWDA